MKELENLKDLYLEEIKKINKKGELTPTDAEAAKKALEAIEMINEICEMSSWDEDEYSERHYPHSMRSMRHYDHMPDVSMRRGRSATTGRYVSRADAPVVDRMVSRLEDMRHDAPDERSMRAIDRAIDTLENY